jgi:hypothetical protein
MANGALRYYEPKFGPADNLSLSCVDLIGLQHHGSLKLANRCYYVNPWNQNQNSVPTHAVPAAAA